MSEHAHVASKKMYFTIFGALMLLTAITVGAAQVDLGIFNVVVALLIAGIKASLVVLFFMHVYHNNALVKLTAACGFIWLIFMFAITFSDYKSRGWLGWPQTWGARGLGVVVPKPSHGSGHGAAPSHGAAPGGQPDAHPAPAHHDEPAKSPDQHKAH